MTPHYGDYYQGNGTPHDAGSPNPIVFMVIPAKSKFTFHVTADTQRLKDVQNWQALMQTAFNHAFKWLGFGAKTAVGYGAMQIVGAKQTSATTTSTPSFQTNEERWEKSTFQYQKGSGEITATGNKKRATVRGDDAKALFVKLPDDKRKLLEKQRLVATAVVKSQGNMNVLFDIV
ncbi:CRISPR type III-B/RAMP module RAMP protein Cmr6 [Thiothrix caldifontis]|uniref:CRISPR type III-B/RAMP module RAMP protein Cmr6 n=2 Tax=Thiothrix caldifontis TaxID=525918 RepID=A0A1H4GHD4_9GAMM|nr:CRISPR type III-B/RAMP module RAMP protein Cmr6 [Thiothrix caldifontis]